MSENGKCKHDLGWLVRKNTHIFIFEDGIVNFDWQGKDRKSFKFQAECNMPDCMATRNVYISAKLIKLGKIKGG